MRLIHNSQLQQKYVGDRVQQSIAVLLYNYKQKKLQYFALQSRVTEMQSSSTKQQAEK